MKTKTFANPANRSPEIIIPLPNGGTIRCGEGEVSEWGGYLRICDKKGNEIVYWDKKEWEEDPECVIGAVFSCAVTPIKELLSSLNREIVVDGCWQ